MELPWSSYHGSASHKMYAAKRVGGLVHGRWPHCTSRDAAVQEVQRERKVRKAEGCLEEARAADLNGRHSAAAKLFEEAARMLAPMPAVAAVAASDAWADCGTAHLEAAEVLEALVACERGLRLADHWRCGMTSALALESLGLLNLAEERFKSAALLAVESGKRATLESLRRVRAREKELDLGNAQVQVEEIQRMGALLGDEEAGYWVSCVGECSRTAEGQKELIQKGFLHERDQNLLKPAEVARRASVVALRYRMNKKLQRHLASAGLLMGVADRCILPKALRTTAAEGFLDEDARQRLLQKRLVVVDEAVPLEAVAKVQLELQRLRSVGIMQNDTNDVCNPLQEAKYLPFAAGEAAREFREKCPTTMEVMQKLAGLACILEDELGLRLAVPQSAMAACYPPRAAYKMHLDSYFLQGCKDDIPRKVTVLLYCNHAWEKQMGGELRTWEPFDQGRGNAQVIEPLAGRLVVFLSEEIWHEVCESHADRYALTVWMHDRDRSSGTLTTETTDGC